MDNVEANLPYIQKHNIDLDQLYALLAKKVKQDYNISYFKCGMEWNKLSNSKFEKDNMKKDPRSFKTEEIYSDFSIRKHLDLLRPKFKLENIELNKKAFNEYYSIIVNANKFNLLSLIK